MKAITFAGAITFLAVPTAAVAQDVDKLPSILVSGSGEVETDPDRAKISYSLRGEGSTSDDAVRAMVAMGEKVEAAIKGIDPKADARTGSVTSEPARSASCGGEDYNAREQLSKGVCAIQGYIATQQITVTTALVKEVGTMAGLAARHGAESAQARQFELSEDLQTRAYASALSKAFRDAEKNALALAVGSGVKLGSILTAANISQAENSSEEGQDIVVTGSRVPTPAPPAVAVKLKPQKITTSARVNVRYLIQR